MHFPALGIAADTPQPRWKRGEEYERKARPNFCHALAWQEEETPKKGGC